MEHTIPEWTEIGKKVNGLASTAYSRFKDIKDDRLFQQHSDKCFDGLDKNYNALINNNNFLQNNDISIKNVEIKIQETLKDIKFNMKTEFQNVLENINELKVADKVSGLLTFIDSFMKNSSTLRLLSPNVRISELERPGSILEKLRDAIKPDGILHGNLHHILNQGLASPTTLSDQLAFNTLDVLYFSVKTYVLVLFFMIEQYSYLADHYHQNGNIVKTNEYFDWQLLACLKFKNELLGSNGLLQKVIETIRNIRKSQSEKQNHLYAITEERLKTLQTEIKALENVQPTIIAEQPEKILRTPDFRKSSICTPIGKWKNGDKVCYATQYKNNDTNTFSKFSEWSTRVVVSGKANPQLRIPSNSRRANRLIFRKFDNEKPELIGIMDDDFQTESRDRNRDFYNAALALNTADLMCDVEILLQNGADINAIFEKDRRAIHAAPSSDNVEFAEKYLIESTRFGPSLVTDINVKDSEGFTPIHVAAESNCENFVELLMRKCAEINAKTNDERTPLHIAASKGHKSVFATLIKNSKIDINAKDKEGFTRLHVAVFGGLPVLQMLIANTQIDVNAKSKESLTPLHLAVISNFLSITKALLECKNININAQAEGKFTELSFAAMSGNLNMIKLLAPREELDVNAGGIENWTALHFRTAIGDEKIVSELLKIKSTDVDAKTKAGVAPLHLAVYFDHYEMLLKLLKIDAEIDDGFTALHIAAMQNNVKIISALLEKGSNLESRTLGGLTPLLAGVSSYATNVNAVKYFLIPGANIKATNNNEENYIWVAAGSGRAVLMEYVINHSNSLQLRDESGNTLLHHAAKSGNLTVVQYLIEEKQMDVNIKNRKDETPLFQSLLNEHVNIFSYLLSKGGNIYDDMEYTFLHKAAYFNKINIAKFLLEQQKINIDVVYKSLNETPLHIAAQNGKTEILKFLIQRGANLNSRNKFGETALHLASECGHFEIVKYLIEEQKCNIETMTDLNLTPLLVATSWGHLNIVKYLIEEKHANVNALTENLDGICHEAVFSKNLELIKYLIEKQNVDIHVKNKKGETPLCLIKYIVDPEICNYLETLK